MSPGMSSGQSKAHSTKVTPQKGPSTMLMMAESPTNGPMLRQRETNESDKSTFQFHFPALPLHPSSDISVELQYCSLLEHLGAPFIFSIVLLPSFPLCFFLLFLGLAVYFRHAIYSHPFHIGVPSFCFLSLSSYPVALSSLELSISSSLGPSNSFSKSSSVACLLLTSSCALPNLRLLGAPYHGSFDGYPAMLSFLGCLLASTSLVINLPQSPLCVIMIP